MLDGVLEWCCRDPLLALGAFVGIGIIAGIVAGWRSHAFDARPYPRC